MEGCGRPGRTLEFIDGARAVRAELVEVEVSDDREGLHLVAEGVAMGVVVAALLVVVGVEVEVGEDDVVVLIAPPDAPRGRDLGAIGSRPVERRAAAWETLGPPPWFGRLCAPGDERVPG